MLLKRVAVQNVRSFFERTDIFLDGNISILVGPNGGGKTNILDIITVVLRRYLYSSSRFISRPTPEVADNYDVEPNDALNQLILEPHHLGKKAPQLVELEIEVTATDIENLIAIKNTVKDISNRSKIKYRNLNIEMASEWNLTNIKIGDRYIYSFNNGAFLFDRSDNRAVTFHSYLQIFELFNHLRAELDEIPLSTRVVYLPVNRSFSGITSVVQLGQFNEYEVKRQLDATTSRSGNQIVNLAIGRLAIKYRLLLENDRGTARKELMQDPNLRKMGDILSNLGYEWSLETRNPIRNEYDLALRKHGTSFLIGAASSGEREIITYLLAIFGLNVRDALIIVDEPELHLHPSWQKMLMGLFVDLAEATGNQFLLATHSPTFISPESIRFVSRVYSLNQRSYVVRLKSDSLPSDRHLLQIVNSQNNERLFFADAVILVEGVSDRIFFQSLLRTIIDSKSVTKTIEVIDVGGKHFFSAYKSLLTAFNIWHATIADLDYIEQVGDNSVKSLFRTNGHDIKTDVLENIKSKDGDSLVKIIDEAMTSGSWGNARDLWEYIKSRRKVLRSNISVEERKALQAFLEEKKKDYIYILEFGTLEDYLPNEFRSKDIEKLLNLLNTTNYLDLLSVDSLRYLNEIIESIVNVISEQSH